MQHLHTVLKWLAAVGGAALGWFGGWSPLLTALCAFMGIDYLTGLIVACRGRSPKTESGGLSSRAGFMGLLRKALVILVVLMATVLDHAIGNEQLVFQSAAVCYYIANEGLSIFENMALLDVPIPEPLKKALELFRKKGEGPSDPPTA